MARPMTIEFLLPFVVLTLAIWLLLSDTNAPWPLYAMAAMMSGFFTFYGMNI